MSLRDKVLMRRSLLEVPITANLKYDQEKVPKYPGPISIVR
jgi:hypothetical protein